jgi:hypothetical protein
MTIAPILTIVRDLHASAGFSEQCPLNSQSLKMWLSDSASRYEVMNRAPKIDFAVCLPMMFEANFHESNEKSFIEQLRDWVCILLMLVIMARPSEVLEYCPDAESIEMPINRKDWGDDNIPKWLKVTLVHWKGKKNKVDWVFFLHRNGVDSRFCPVVHMLLWLTASKIKKGSIFPKIRDGNILIAFEKKVITIDKRSVSQWVTETGQVERSTSCFKPYLIIRFVILVNALL